MKIKKFKIAYNHSDNPNCTCEACKEFNIELGTMNDESGVYQWVQRGDEIFHERISFEDWIKKGNWLCGLNETK